MKHSHESCLKLLYILRYYDLPGFEFVSFLYYGVVTDKVMHKKPLCICTGTLEKFALHTIFTCYTWFQDLLLYKSDTEISVISTVIL